MRVFVGISVPDAIRVKIQAAWDACEDRPTDFRATAPQNWHCTLAFLGKVNDAHIPILEHLLEKAAERPPRGSFCIRDFDTFPHKKPAYLIARVIPEPADTWMAFTDRLRDLISVALPGIDRKPWIPHIAIGRARKGHPLPAWKRTFEPIDWTPHEISLVRSELTKDGSIYTDIRVFPLTPRESRR
ncbi:RNA 2',3'-cyclic phosphodiesterase [Patescibacteria group bacterium]|nr:RNA 2',3'-cyclic phosphodiesterase [Patescibacteria group bacterium]